MTLLGTPTVGDVEDLINAKVYDVNRLAANWLAFSPTWVQNDAASANDWGSDWAVFSEKWNNVLQPAMTTVQVASAGPVPLALITDQGDWDALLRALKQVDGVQTKGDFDDLFVRLNNANKQWGGNADFSNWQTPQPKNPDADITALDVADQILSNTPLNPKAPVSNTLKKDLSIAAVAIGGFVIAYGAVKLGLKALLMGL